MDISKKRDHRNANPLDGQTFKKRCILQNILVIRSLTLNLFSLSMTYCELSLYSSSGVEGNYPIQKKLVMKNIPYRNDPVQVFP